MRDTEEVMPTADEWHEALIEKVNTIASGAIALVQPSLITKFNDIKDDLDLIRQQRTTPMNQYLRTTPSEVKREQLRKKRKRGK